MKLEPDCIRDILFVIEENTSYKVGIRYPDDKFASLSEKYTDMQIRYHLVQMQKADLIEIGETDEFYNIYIEDLTSKGHEFLANIRSDSNWVTVQHVCSKIGSKSINTLFAVGTNIMTILIKQYLGF